MKKDAEKMYKRMQILLKLSICFILLCLMNLSVYAADEITSTVYKIDGQYISKIKGKTTVSAFKENVETEQEMVFTNKKGATLNESATIATETTLTVGAQKYTLIVRGDVDGNGLVNATDLSKLKLYKSGKLKPTEAAKRAGDINGNGVLDDEDIEKLNLILVGVDIDDVFSISNVKTYREEIETDIFQKDEKITIRFNSDSTEYYAKKMKVNGKEYEVTKNEDSYEIVIDGFSNAGKQEIKIEEAFLNNGQSASINQVLEVIVLKEKPSIDDLTYEELETSVKLKFTVTAEDFDTIDGTLTITDEYGNEVKKHSLVIGENEVIFDKESTVEYYDLKFTVSYHDGKEDHNNETIKEEQISVNGRSIEMKDIIGIKLYRQTGENASAVYDVNLSDLENLNDFVVKVEMKDIRSFYATIREYKEEDGKLKFVLDYENIVQYEGDKKSSQLEVEFGKIENGVATRLDLERLIQLINENPAGDFVVTSDLDATNSNLDATIITSEFTGTIDFGGHKITNLSKPLFNTLNGATIKNLVLENVTLGNASKGAIANTATDMNIKNVHIKNFNLTTGSNQTAGFIGTATGGTIEECSLTNANITTSGHIRIAGIVGYMEGGAIKNCYVQGKMTSTQSKDGNGIGGIVGHATGSNPITIENCISKIEFMWTGGGQRMNGAIIGLSQSSNTILKNNISLSTGTIINKVFGSAIAKTSTNNYELEESELVSNASGDIVKKVSKDGLTQEFFRDSANFNEDIWDLRNSSYEHLPTLKNADPNDGENKEDARETSNNGEIYIPDYERIKKLPSYDVAKEIAYSNLYKLMPFYDAKYLVEDGANIPADDILNTKIVKYALPYDADHKLITYITEEDSQKMASIKVIFNDNTVQDYELTFDITIGNIVIYKIKDTKIPYSYNNYVIKQNASIVNTLTDAIKNFDYTNDLDPLTTTADARHYKDHYNEVIKASASNIALQLLQNEEDSILNLDNEVLNKKIKTELIDSGKLKKVIYAYNYYDRWYNFEIGGAKVSDILLFENKMFKDNNTLDYLVNEVLVGNIGVNSTDSFFKSNIGKYTGSSELKYFLDYIITNIGGYSDVNDWFTEYFGARNILAEFGVDKNPEILYRGWYQLKKNGKMILPVITMPENCTYMISGPAHLQIGPSQLYHKDVDTAAGQAAVRKIVNDHLNLVKRHLNTLAGSFDPGKWNNYCIMVYDCTKIITSYKTSYFPGTNIVIGTSPVYTQGKVGQNYPFFKNFSEVLGLWQPGGSAAGVGNTAGFLWFIARPGLTNFDTWTHEFEHALFDKIMLFQAGTRFKYGLETLTEGNVEQNGVWSENNLVQDVGPYYFNTTFDLNKEGNATQNLSPDRIDTREKLENYFKGQQNALDLLDYIEGKAFIRLTPEQQARVATRMNQSGSWSSWGAITAEQAAQMNLTSLESLYDNRIIIRPENAWGVSVRGLSVINSIGQNDYGFESVWVNRWYIGHNDNGIPDAFSAKRNYFEMLGYAGVDGYVTYGRGSTATDLDAIQKITQSVTGTAMNWKEYKMSRYATVEENIKNNKYIDVDYMIERFYEALASDNNRNASQRTNLRKIYYHYLKSATNDFTDDPLGTTVEVNHIATAEELVEKLNSEPYGYYVLDNDIDFSHMTTNVTQTFMGRLDGQGHKIIGNTLPIFNKIRYGYVGNIHFENTNIPKTINNAGALSYKAEMSTVEKISASNLQMNFGGRNDLSLIGGAVSNVVTRDCSVEKLTYHISSVEDMAKLNEDTSGIFVIDNDIDFAGKTYNGTVISNIFTGKIDGQGYTFSNLTDASLFANFRGTVENLTISNFTNTGAGRGNGDFVAAFTQESFTATFRNMKFENITLSGRNNVAVITGMDGRDNANSVFENIAIKDANVTGTGVYVSTCIGRKYNGTIKNVYVQGTLNVTSTENGGLVGCMQQGGTIENVITDVAITKSSNTYNNIESSRFNASLIGNIYNTPKVKNSISFGNMSGYTDSEGNEILPYKCVGASESQINSCLTNCYEVEDETGASRVTENTNGKLNSITKANLSEEFYRNLGFNEDIWNFDTVSSKGYPELK